MSFVLGLAAGLFLAILAGVIGRALARSISIQLPERWQRRGKASAPEKATSAPSRARSSSPDYSSPTRKRPVLKVVESEDDAKLAAALRQWQFTKPEIDRALTATREFAGPFEERVRTALATLRRHA